MKAMVEVGLKRKDLRQTFLSYLEGIVEKNEQTTSANKS